MRRQLRRSLERMSGLLRRAATAVWTSPAEARVRPWFAAQGDTTLRLDYDLSPQSVVFDLGGYEGQWASDIFAMYCCQVYVFEPVPAFAERIRRRFRCNPKVHVFQFGLGARNETARIGLARDASSLYRSGADGPEVRLVSAADFLREHAIAVIDLMKINIEGGEYDLLDHLVSTGGIDRIRNLQVQFHDFVPDAQARMTAIQGRLAQTHEPTYQYPFVWENWRLRA